MHPLFSTPVVVTVGVLAVLWPIFARVVSSPLTLLIISPFVLIFLATTFWLSNVFLGHYLDSKRPYSRGDLSTAARPFAFSTPAAWQVVLTRSQWSHKSPQSFSPLYPESPVVSAALNDILIMIVRDFVLTWYKDISTSPSFPTAVSVVLHDSLERLLNRAAGIDLPVLIVKRILPKITAHIEQFRQSEVALRGAGLERRLTQSEELDLLLASRYGTKGGEKLHPAVDNLSTTFTKQTEEMHLRQLVDKALPFVLPEKEAKSKVLRVVVREIVTCSVLYPVLEMLADPDFWNRAIDQVVRTFHPGISIHLLFM
jgi:sorting nexin-25